jgi:phosphoribosylformylglycinamidine synthase
MKKMKLAEFLVLVTIENKSYVSDPEGETIFRDLISKAGFSNITKVRVAKSLKLTVEAEDKSRAEKTVRMMCEELRIYNPVVSECTVTTIARLSKHHSRNPKMI